MTLDEDRTIKAAAIIGHAMGEHLHGHIAESIKVLLGFANSMPRMISVEDVKVTFKVDILARDGTRVQMTCRGEGPERFTHFVKCNICGHEFPEQMEKCPLCRGVTEQQRANMRMTDADRWNALCRAMTPLLEVRDSVFHDPERQEVKALADHALDTCTKIASLLKE